jgi:membrane protein YqaA with SNARE-associated domain
MTNYKKMIALNRYYKITKFYAFLKNVAIKGAITIAVIVGIVLILEYYFLDINALLDTLVSTFSPFMIFLVFAVSESLLGMLPPEIFIAWSAKSEWPWIFLMVLASLSYLGGIVSYFIGMLLHRIPQIKTYTEVKIAMHISNLRKWGGVLVFVGAMLPIPHSVVGIACGLIKYDFKHYLVWALFRYVRFIIYAFVIFKVF